MKEIYVRRNQVVSGFWDKCNVVMETTFSECI